MSGLTNLFHFNLQEEVASLQEELEKYKNLHQRSESDMLKRNELRGKMISTMGRELAALRSGQKLTESHFSNGKESTSVKNLIAAIEKQVKDDRGTPPLSPSISVQDESSRRNSVESTISISSMKSETSPKIVLDRRTSAPVDSPYKIPSRRTGETRLSESRSPLSHRHTITNIILEEKDDKQTPLSSVKGSVETDGSGKKLTGILSHKSSLWKTSLRFVNSTLCVCVCTRTCVCKNIIPYKMSGPHSLTLFHFKCGIVSCLVGVLTGINRFSAVINLI